MDKPLVLIADDNEATCTLVTAVLRSEFAVEVARDGHEAIEKLKSRRYAAVLLDLLMPVADGYAVLDYLRAERPDVLSRVMVITASVGVRQMERIGEYPVRRVIPKPFEVDVLFNSVRECAGSAGHGFFGAPIVSSGVLLLLAEVLRRV